MGDAGSELSQDLFCLSCAYNLRGLSGDPIRCPECGTENPVELLSLGVPLIVAHIQRVEYLLRNAARCLGFAILAFLCVAFGAMKAYSTVSAPEFPVWCFVFAMSIVLASAWIVHLRRYLLLTVGAPHRMRMFLLHQLGYVLSCVSLAVIVIGLLVGLLRSGIVSPVGFVAVFIGTMLAPLGGKLFQHSTRGMFAPLTPAVVRDVLTRLLAGRDRKEHLRELGVTERPSELEK